MSNYIMNVDGGSRGSHGDYIIFSDENYRHKAIEFLESLNKTVKGELYANDCDEVPFISIKEVEQRLTAFELGVLTKNAEEKYKVASRNQRVKEIKEVKEVKAEGIGEIELNQYVRDACRTECEYNHELNWRLENSAGILHGIIGLQTEIGELSDAVKRYIFYGKDLDVTNLGEEIGDICYYIALVCKHLNINWEEILKKNIMKLKIRYPEGFSQENAINRNLDEERKVL